MTNEQLIEGLTAWATKQDKVTRRMVALICEWIANDKKEKSCDECGGFGTVVEAEDSWSGYRAITRQCKACNGSGKISKG